MAEDELTPDPGAEDPVVEDLAVDEPVVDEPVEEPQADEPEAFGSAPYETVIYEEPVVERPVGTRTTAGGWALLVVVALLALLLGAVVLHADIAGMQDPGWQDNALWAASAGLALLGLALAAVSWTVATESDQGFTRVAVLAAVIGVIAASVLVGVADVQAGERPDTIVAAAPVVAGADEATPAPPGPDASSGLVSEAPIIPADAQDLENLTSLAQVIESRTFVNLELTLTGRRLLAQAMRCQPGDFSGTDVVGVAVGGTWVQPLVAVEAPRRGEQPIQRCHQAVIRLPIQAGLARPA